MLTGCFGQADRFRQADPVQNWRKPPRQSSGRVKHTQSCNFHDHERREQVLDTLGSRYIDGFHLGNVGLRSLAT